MATYFRPPPVRTSVHAVQPQADGAQAHSHAYQPSEEVEAQSIYIFPVPSSVPASPGGSSDFSAPSDFADTDTFAASSQGRSRHSSVSSRFTEFTRSRAGSVNQQLLQVEEGSEVVFSPYGDITLDSEVEVWDWSDEATDDLPFEGASWELETEREGEPSDRPWNLITRPSLSRRPEDAIANARAQLAYPVRSRTQSSSSIQSTRSPRHVPHPRMRVPLLSLFASILSIGLDDPGLRLLTHSTADSVLFPGQSGLLDSLDTPPPSCTTELSPDGISTEDKPHGVLRLLTDGPETKSVRDGLAAICDNSLALPNPFVLPTLSSLKSLCQFVGAVWTNGGEAWRELEGSSERELR